MPRRRPWGISLLSIVYIASGAFGLLSFAVLSIGGVEISLWRTVESSLATSLHSQHLAFAGLVALYVLWLGFYVYCVLVGLGLWRLHKWAWRTVAAMFWLSFVGMALVAVVMGLAQFQFKFAAIASTAAAPYGGVLFYLYLPEVRNAFTTPI